LQHRGSWIDLQPSLVAQVAEISVVNEALPALVKMVEDK
jgi:hypothetical protein